MMHSFAPMLAVAGEPFDSPDYSFEIKWDGLRALAECNSKGWRLWGRKSADYTVRYPELTRLRQFPPQTVVDGELVQLVDGCADFDRLLSRHQLVSARKIREAAVQYPVTYLLFDLLQLNGQLLLDQPLQQRRQQLQRLLEQLSPERLVFSQGVVGAGREFYQQVISQGHEGVIAKRLDSRYSPGHRASAWRKIKPRQSIACVILGFKNQKGKLDSVLLGASQDGQLSYVGEVRAGLSASIRGQLQPLLTQCRCAEPVVMAPAGATWVRPELYCLVDCFGIIPQGRLRCPSFCRLLDRTQIGGSSL
jgi:bifunctional non-homologous end joining protein LigD